MRASMAKHLIAWSLGHCASLLVRFLFAASLIRCIYLATFAGKSTSPATCEFAMDCEKKTRLRLPASHPAWGSNSDLIQPIWEETTMASPLLPLKAYAAI